MTLTKAELADLLFEQLGLNKREAKDMVERFFEEIRIALEVGDSVKLSGFGNFQLREKPQRPGRNPKTGEEIPITARRVVTFHASQKLKQMVEQHYGNGNGGQQQPHRREKHPGRYPLEQPRPAQLLQQGKVDLPLIQARLQAVPRVGHGVRLGTDLYVQPKARTR